VSLHSLGDGSRGLQGLLLLLLLLLGRSAMSRVDAAHSGL